MITKHAIKLHWNGVKRKLLKERLPQKQKRPDFQNPEQHFFLLIFSVLFKITGFLHPDIALARLL